MPLTIHPRAEWAVHVVPWWRAHAAAEPAPSGNPAWDPRGRSSGQTNVP